MFIRKKKLALLLRELETKCLNGTQEAFARSQANYNELTKSIFNLEEAQSQHSDLAKAQTAAIGEKWAENRNTLRTQGEMLENLARIYKQQDAWIEKLSEDSQRTEAALAEQTVHYHSLRQDLAQTMALLSTHRADQNSDHWMTKFGIDCLLSNLQLALVECYFSGNRSRLSTLKNTHMGEKCFIIGNGPSLTAADLTALHVHGVYTFASKRINAIYDQTPWRPDVWAASDLGFIKDHAKEINSLTDCIKLLPCQTIINLDLKIDDALYFPFIQMERTPAWFNLDILRGIHFYGTITGKLINIAAYMGFKEIYLLGVDHSWPVSRDENGKAVFNTKQPIHFSKAYDTAAEKEAMQQQAEELMHIVEVISQAYKNIKYYCDELGIKIYNATRGGKLETYPRVDFESIMNQLADVQPK